MHEHDPKDSGMDEILARRREIADGFVSRSLGSKFMIVERHEAIARHDIAPLIDERPDEA